MTDVFFFYRKIYESNWFNILNVYLIVKTIIITFLN